LFKGWSAWEAIREGEERVDSLVGVVLGPHPHEWANGLAGARGATARRPCVVSSCRVGVVGQSVCGECVLSSWLRARSWTLHHAHITHHAHRPMAGVLHVVRLHEVRQSSKENGRTDPEGGAETQGGGEANSALVSSPLLIPTHTHTHTHTHPTHSLTRTSHVAVRCRWGIYRSRSFRGIAPIRRARGLPMRPPQPAQQAPTSSRRDC
jgi:hypothetical protein